MDNQNTSRQLRYLEEVRTPLHRAGFGTLPVEGEQLPVLWNGTPLCRITGKGSVFYRREDADTPQAEDALYRVEDIAAKTLEYMTARAWYTDTTSWRNMTKPSRTSPHAQDLSKRNSFSARNS